MLESCRCQYYLLLKGDMLHLTLSTYLVKYLHILGQVSRHTLPSISTYWNAPHFLAKACTSKVCVCEDCWRDSDVISSLSTRQTLLQIGAPSVVGDAPFCNIYLFKTFLIVPSLYCLITIPFNPSLITQNYFHQFLGCLLTITYWNSIGAFAEIEL